MLNDIHKCFLGFIEPPEPGQEEYRSQYQGIEEPIPVGQLSPKEYLPVVMNQGGGGICCQPEGDSAVKGIPKEVFRVEDRGQKHPAERSQCNGLPDIPDEDGDTGNYPSKTRCQ